MKLQDISLLQIAGLLKQRLEKSHYYFSPISYIHMINNHGDITGCRKISYMVFSQRQKHSGRGNFSKIIKIFV